MFFCLEETLKRRGAGDRGAEGRDPGLRQRRLAVREVRRRAAGAKVVAVSDSRRAAATTRAGSTSLPLLAHKRRGRPDLPSSRAGETITNDELLALPCDVLAPCALEQVLDETNADRVRAQDRRRGGERPDDAGGGRDPRVNGVLVIPDVLANAGGVVVSYFEWVQGLQELFWEEEEVNERLQGDRRPRLRRDLGAPRVAPDLDADGRLRPRRPARRRGEHDPRPLSLSRCRRR